MDMLDFDSESLYFDEPLDSQTKQLLDAAAENYGEAEAEESLLRAYFLEPEHPMVLVALYRYYYYQHRLEDALRVAERVLKTFAERLELPRDWQRLTEQQIGNGVMVSMTMIRFYMLALKGAGYLELRLGRHEAALARLQKVADLDTNDRLGAQALLNVVREALNEEMTA
jgi:tetratricopeptide (TPR) repeat protein